MLSVSSALVALGFVNQASTGSSGAFLAFALTVLPTLYLLGCATYVRMVECSAEDLRYAIVRELKAALQDAHFAARRLELRYCS